MSELWRLVRPWTRSTISNWCHIEIGPTVRNGRGGAVANRKFPTRQPQPLLQISVVEPVPPPRSQPLHFYLHALSSPPKRSRCSDVTGISNRLRAVRHAASPTDHLLINNFLTRPPFRVLWLVRSLGPCSCRCETRAALCGPPIRYLADKRNSGAVGTGVATSSSTNNPRPPQWLSPPSDLQLCDRRNRWSPSQPSIWQIPETTANILN